MTRLGRSPARVPSECLDDGDVLTITDIETLPRGVPALVDVVRRVRERGAKFRELSGRFDTTTARGAAFFQWIDAIGRRLERRHPPHELGGVWSLNLRRAVLHTAGSEREGDSRSVPGELLEPVFHEQRKDYSVRTTIVPSGGVSTRGRRSRWLTLSGAAVAACLLLGTLVPGASPAAADSAPADPTAVTSPETVTADALPTPQINGVVWDQLVVGDVVYVGGDFSSARPFGAKPGTNESSRSNFLAYDLHSGELLPYAPTFDAQVRALDVSPDGKRLYVGGRFQKANGAPRYRLAAFDLPSGNLVTTFRPYLNAGVAAIQVSETGVFVGGTFTAARGATGTTAVARTNAAAFAADGSVLPWAPQMSDGWVNSLLLSPDESTIVLGGTFRALNGSSEPGYTMGAVDTATGTTMLPWEINSLVPNRPYMKGIEKDWNVSVYSLASDGEYVYGTTGPTGFEGTFKARWSDGEFADDGWVADCHGDSYSVAAVGDVVYTASHAHDCGNVNGFEDYVEPDLHYRALAFSTERTQTTRKEDAHYWNDYEGQPAPSLLDWYPAFNTGRATGQGPWDVTAAKGYVLYGGEFSTVNKVGQQGLTRFGTKEQAPNKQGPILEAGNMAPTISQWGTSATRLSWTANWDRDNALLTYQLIRDGKTDKPVYTTTMESRFWDRPAMSYIDRDCLVPGSAHTYQLRVLDPFGNTRWGSTVTYTVPQPKTPSTSTAHRLQPDGSVGSVGTVPAGSTAIGPNGDYLTAAGELNVLHVGSKPAATNVSSANGAFLENKPFLSYMTTDRQSGAFAHRINPNGTATHYPSVPAGSKVVGANGDFLAPNGDLYDLAVKTTPVASKVASAEGLWTEGRGNSITYVTIDQQAGAYAHRVNPDGSITRFPSVPAGSRPVDAEGGTLAPNGDLYVQNGRIASNVTSADGIRLSNGLFVSYTTTDLQGGAFAHRYALPTGHQSGGSARLPAIPAGATVVGATGDFLTKNGDLYFYMSKTPAATNVTSAVGQYHAANGPYLAYTDAPCFGPEAPSSNKAPTAAFASTTDALTASLDGAGSSDPDGAITAYAWDFGNGSTGSGKTTRATYAKAGTFTVTLTVTDDDGATATTSKTVTVTAPAAVTSAADDFERTVAGNWGAAQTGGTWSLAGPKKFAVSGGTGTIDAARGHTYTATLPNVTTTETTTSAVFALDEAPTGGGQHLSVIGRQVGPETYSARVIVFANGRAVLAVLRSGTVLESVGIAGTYVAGQPISIRVSVTGTGTAAVAASAWMGDSAAPDTWQIEVQDTTATLQHAGTVGISTYTSSSGAAGVIRVDMFRSSAK